MHIHKTLDSIQRRSAQRSQQHRLEQEQMHAADIDTISLRAEVNARCEPHANVSHMLCIAVHNHPDITGESKTVVYCVFGLYDIVRAWRLTRIRSSGNFGMVCAVWPIRWNFLQPSRANGADQKKQRTADAAALPEDSMPNRQAQLIQC